MYCGCNTGFIETNQGKRQMSQPIHTTIELSGLRLEVIGTYYKGEDASMDSPGEEESIEIDSVLTPKGDDISGLIADNDDLQIEVDSKVLEAFKDGRMCAAQDAAEMRRERLAELEREAA
jgi:hypothetical protein